MLRRVGLAQAMGASGWYEGTEAVDGVVRSAVAGALAAGPRSCLSSPDARCVSASRHDDRPSVPAALGTPPSPSRIAEKLCRPTAQPYVCLSMSKWVARWSNRLNKGESLGAFDPRAADGEAEALPLIATSPAPHADQFQNTEALAPARSARYSGDPNVETVMATGEPLDGRVRADTRWCVKAGPEHHGQRLVPQSFPALTRASNPRGVTSAVMAVAPKPVEVPSSGRS
jgi:hypothetical protein